MQHKMLILNALVVPNSRSADKEPLLGNPNVVLVSLGKLLSEDRGQWTFIVTIVLPSLSAILFNCQSHWLAMTIMFACFQSRPYKESPPPAHSVALCWTPATTMW